jgi:hypothetical protein
MIFYTSCPPIKDFAKNIFLVLLTLRREEWMIPGGKSGTYFSSVPKREKLTMRLTLRNMLAYLDGILEPQDAQDLSKKIEESKFASDLMHRIRDLMRRMRLAAPSISERGPGLDPNTVAEYLDNTLPADRVTDFEKVCLEANTTMADIHLAEVAACHQVLTIVLGEPADIDPAMRERIYQLPSLAAQQKPEPAPQNRPVHLPPPIPANPPQQTSVQQEFLDYKSRSKPTVPDYLREPRKKRSWFTIALGALATVCLLLIILNVAQQFKQDSALGKVLVRWGWVAPKKDVATTATNPKESNTTSKDEVDKKNQTTDNVNKNPSEKSPTENTDTKTSELLPNPGNGTLPETKTVNAPGVEIPAVSPPGTDTIPGVTDTVQTPATPTGESQTAVPGNGMPDNGAVPTSDTKTNPDSTLTVKPIENQAVAQKPMGRFTSPEQILLRSKGDSGNWEREPDKAILYPNQHLLALPTYRPTITLNSGLILQMLGGTEVALLPGDQQLPPGIKIRYGRVVINSVAKAGIPLRLEIGGQTGVLTFLDADTNVGIEVRRIHALGVNPEEEADRTMMEILITKDRVAWDDGSGKPLEIAAPAQILIWPKIPPVTDHPKDFPKWISSPESIQAIERRASVVMMQSFTPETPAQQKLLELADIGTRLIEVRRLAVRCLGYVGYFEPMVSALNDPANKGDWADHYVDWLCEAVKRDPQTAAAVREALDKKYGTQAANLYRMLWGYTNNDLMAGEDANLVKNLDDECLAVRVLAICNLKLITDKDLGFKPEATISQRSQIVKRWEQRREGNEIRNKQSEKKNSSPTPEPPPPPAVGGLQSQ